MCFVYLLNVFIPLNFDTSYKLKYLCIELGMARDCRHNSYGLVLPDILGKSRILPSRRIDSSNRIQRISAG